MSIDKTTVIIADDLTGANDTALQYFKNGYETRVLIDVFENLTDSNDADVWAVSTESRNISKEEASINVLEITEKLKNEFYADNFYKKIDSTLRGNVGVEIVSMLEVLQYDAALIAPAYIEEERTTLGGYQLLKGTPIERTQCALDPKAPIFESYIPDIIKKGLNERFKETIAVIDFKTITKGAGPIMFKINELIQKGKKLIIADAVSNTDLEQIALAIQKSNYKILPCASAGLANAFNKTTDKSETIHKTDDIPKLPRLIISGSATQLTASQIQKLKETQKKIFSFDLTVQDIFAKENDEIVNAVCAKLNEGYDVIVHSSKIRSEMSNDDAKDILIDEGVAKEELPTKITDYLADLTCKINKNSEFILIIIGGETSFKCTTMIDSKHLKIIDAILPAVPLCKDVNGKIIITKSGNFGTSNTLNEIITYLDRLNNV